MALLGDPVELPVTPANPVGRIGRGFLAAWFATADDWFEHGDIVHAKTPCRRVTLATPPIMPRILSLQPTGQDLVAVADRTITVKSGAKPEEVLAARWPGVEFEIVAAEPEPVVTSSPPPATPGS